MRAVDLRRLVPVLAVFVLWRGLAVGGVSPENAEVLLQQGVPVNRRLSMGERQHYRVRLEEGQFVRISVDQRGIDITLVLTSPEGRVLREMDSAPDWNWGPDDVSWITTESGDLGVEVRPSESEGPAGEYEVRVAELRAALPADRKRIEAEAAFADGYRALYQESFQTRRRSFEAFERALAVWEELGDRRHQAITLFSLGRAQNSLNRADLAIDSYERALPLWRSVGEQVPIEATLFGLAIAKRLSGRPDEARTDFEEALSIARKLRDGPTEGELLTSLGDLESSVGERQKALANYELALPIAKATQNRNGECRTLVNIASVREYLGQKQRALDGYREALEVCRPLGSKAVDAKVLSNIGRTYLDLGDRSTGLKYLLSAERAVSEIGDQRTRAGILLQVGRARQSAGDLAQAGQAFEEALGLWKKIADPAGEGAARNLLGQLRTESGRFEDALSEFEQTLSLARKAKDTYLEASALSNRGALRASRGDLRAGRADLEAAFRLQRELGDRIGEASALLDLARIETSEGHPDASWICVSRALDLAEALRTEVASQNLRATFFATVQSLYDSAIEMLMRRAQTEQDSSFATTALEVNERSRSRSLLDLLQARDLVQGGVDPELLKRERALRKQIAARVDDPERTAGQSGWTLANAVDLEKLRDEYQKVQERIRASSPRYSALAFGEPVKLEALRQDLLDEDTLLLEYSPGAEGSYLWVVGRDGVWTYVLPTRDIIEAAARKVYESVRSPGAVDAAAAVELTRLILGPAKSRLSGKRLVVIPDGVLHLIPFAVLPLPETLSPHSAFLRLIDKFELVNAPSASVLGVIRREETSRVAPSATLAVLADPVFSRPDPRARPATRTSARGSSLRIEELISTDSNRELDRLPFTRREAQAIARLVQPRERKVALDFEANLEAALSPDLSRYRYLHLATHGVTGGDHPDRSGLYFSTVSPSGASRDGFLSVGEIFNMRLSADVVVLSACQTALGKEIRGEGLVGLTRAFMYAGAPRVVASLWRVDDAATAELMKKFYEGMLGPEKLRPAAALRQAQLAISKQRRWQHPYYWAGFVLQGEWR